MPALALSLLGNPRVLVGIGLALILAYAGLQSARLHHAKADLSAVRVDLTSARAAVAASETSRKAEHRAAVSAAEDIGKACAARVAEAQRSAGAIRRIVEKPVHVDAQTGCPARGVIGADELRDALGLG